VAGIATLAGLAAGLMALGRLPVRAGGAAMPALTAAAIAERVGWIEELGFSNADAVLLATARDSAGFLVRSTRSAPRSRAAPPTPPRWRSTPDETPRP
jgi:hypothetical protein